MTEVEVKLSINEEGYNKLISHLAMHIASVLRQNNIFFIAPDGSLKRNARLRKITTAEMPTRWVFTTKGAGTIKDGISSHSEIEEDVPEKDAQKMLTDTKKLYKYLPKSIKEALKESKKSEFMIQCNFVSIRRVIPYNGFVIEADECILPTMEKYYEIEVESDEPAKAKEFIEGLLNSLDVKFENSTTSKYARCRSVPMESRINLDL